MNPRPLDIRTLIRPADKADLSSILMLYAQPDVDDGKILDLRKAELLFERMRLYPDYRLYVAEIEGIIVGSFALLIMENIAHLGAPSGIIESVVVAYEYQRRGIGREMIRFAIEHCRLRRCYKLALSANCVREHAHAFYLRLGFEWHGYSFKVDLDTNL